MLKKEDLEATGKSECAGTVAGTEVNVMRADSMGCGRHHRIDLWIKNEGQLQGFCPKGKEE